MIRVVGRCLLAVLTTGLLFTSAAYADSFRLRVENFLTGIGVVITDNEVGDANPLTGAITYLGSLSSLAVNITTGISQPLIGSISNYAALHLNSVNIQVSGAGALRLTLEDSYTIGPDGGMSVTGLVGGTLVAKAGSAATFQSWVNADNLVPALGPDAFSPNGLSLASIGAIPAGSVALWSGDGVTFGPGAFSSTASAGFLHDGPYSLFTQATLNFTGAGIVSFDSDLSTVPEPTSLLLLGSGLAGLGLWSRRRKKSAQV